MNTTQEKERLKKQKELEDAEERKKFVDVGALEKAEKEKAQEKKKNLLREQLNDLDLLNKKKNLRISEIKTMKPIC